MRSTIEQTSKLIKECEVSPVELTQDCLARTEKLNPRLNTFITIIADSALAQARRAEQEILRGEYRGPLHGIPLGLKDVIDTAGTRTTAASAQYQDRVPPEDAEVVRRLRSAGAIVLGKHNLHEFAYGGSGMISVFGEMHNPWNLAYITGGSSGGSAASVAAGMGWAAIGTDTAGSVRLPGAYCGVVGFKPTYGCVSARGVVPLARSFDHVGPMANSVWDTAALLQVVAGYDPADPATVPIPLTDYVSNLNQLPSPLRIGIPRGFFYDDLDVEIAVAVENVITVFRELRAEIHDLEIEVSTDRTLSSAEAWAFHEAMASKSPELYHPETLKRIKSGEGISASAFERAREELKRARHDIQRVFEEVDVLLTPTVRIPPPAISDLREHPEDLRRRELVLLHNTRPFNVWGIPAISVPCGFTSGGLPIGLQLAGPPWREDLVLQVAYAYEQRTDWHERTPEL